ncbi:MAG: hypothetical protein AB8G95_12485 [Anaerolineae bacterium]
MKRKLTSVMTLIALGLFVLLLFSPGSVSVALAGFTPTPDPTNTPVLPATNTPVPAATNTPIPAATNTPVPGATNTPVAGAATNTPTSGGGGGNNPTSTPDSTVNRETRANAAENAPNVPALGERMSLGMLLTLNAIFFVLLVGLIFAWRAVARAMRNSN